MSAIIGKTAFEGRSEQFVGPGDIAAQQQHPAMEALEDGARKHGQSFAVFVEKAACRRIFGVTVGNLLRTFDRSARQFMIAGADPARGEGLVDNSVLERKMIDPAVRRDLIATLDQTMLCDKSGTDTGSERQGHHPPGIPGNASQTFAQCKGRGIVYKTKIPDSDIAEPVAKRLRDVQSINAVKLVDPADQRDPPPIVERPGECHSRTRRVDPRTEDGLPDTLGPRIEDGNGPGVAIHRNRDGIRTQGSGCEIHDSRADMASADIGSYSITCFFSVCHIGEKTRSVSRETLREYWTSSIWRELLSP